MATQAYLTPCHPHLCMALDGMVTVTSLPLCVMILLRGMPGLWQGRHRLVLGWLIGIQALVPGRKTLEERARWSPGAITVWRVRRVLTAAY